MKDLRLAPWSIVGWLLACVLGMPPMAAGAPPDLTGVWTPEPAATGGAIKLPALRPEPKRRYDTFNALVAPSGDTPGGVCLGAGMPGALLGAGGYPMEIIQRPEQMTFIFELHGETRRVYFGERNAPERDRVPGRIGYSSGRWEGDELVVETDNLVEQLDQKSTPHSGNATITERYRVEGVDRQGRRILAVQVTMTDPDFYAEPVTLKRSWTQQPDGHLLPYDCNEEVWRERLQGLADKAGVKLP
jgi:hypothetical protein